MQKNNEAKLLAAEIRNAVNYLNNLVARTCPDEDIHVEYTVDGNGSTKPILKTWITQPV